jgi:hypothetical protein
LVANFLTGPHFEQLVKEEDLPQLVANFLLMELDLPQLVERLVKEKRLQQSVKEASERWGKSRRLED